MLKLYNSLTRKTEEFKPIHDGSLNVGMYTCGPTVYDFAHIGNFRTYTTSDLLLRTLQYNGYEVDSVMNITDVGHLTGDNQGDADTGEDRMEKSAKREGKSAWEIAAFYTDAFLKDYKALNLTPPTHLVKATDHIKEQIALIKTLDEKGYTYQTSDGIYFDTTKFKDYGKLSNLDQIQDGARIEVNPEKRNPRDFALWKFEKEYTKNGFPSRAMNWWFKGKYAGEPLLSKNASTEELQESLDRYLSSPEEDRSTVGFPGWHIECSAMAMKYLTDAFDPFGKLRVDGKKNYTIDIHVGGTDLRETHHPNEIAQSEAATGKPFVKYWVHGAFILVQGERMSKSKGNNYKLYDLTERERGLPAHSGLSSGSKTGRQGYDALALRYLYMQAHYRQEMNFTLVALQAAQNALTKLREAFIRLEGDDTSVIASTFDKLSVNTAKQSHNIVISNEMRDPMELTAEEAGISPHGVRRNDNVNDFEKQFLDAINDDLNLPEATSVMWELLKAHVSDSAKKKTLLKFDKILGLDLENAQIIRNREEVIEIPDDIRQMVNERKRLRNDHAYKAADQLRDKIHRLGYEIDDTEKGTLIKKLKK